MSAEWLTDTQLALLFSCSKPEEHGENLVSSKKGREVLK